MTIDKILSRAVLASTVLADKVAAIPDALAAQNALISPAASAKVPKSGDLTLFGSFDWNPSITEAEEIALLIADDKSWSPSTLDFMAVTGLSPTFSVGNFEAVLAEVGQHKPGSIRRLNLFAHGNTVSLGISGDIIPGNIRFTSLVNAERIRDLNNPGLTITARIGGRDVDFTLADIRSRFAKDARMVIYSCNAAVETELLQSLADLLRVHVIGFDAQTLFCPPVQKDPPFKRKGTKIGIAVEPGGCKTNPSQSDWRMLIAHRNTVVANPK